MNYWKVIIATMVIFGTGVVTGGLLVRHESRWRPNRSVRQAVPVPNHSSNQPMVAPAALRFDLLRRMQKELDLTAEQRDRIDHILSQSQERTRKLMEPLKPQINEELKRTRQQFREALTPAQRARFDAQVRQQQHQKHAQTGRDHPAVEDNRQPTNSPVTPLPDTNTGKPSN